MKGYYDSKEKILYIFPQEVGTIPNVDAEAEAIAIQQENLAEWKEANEDYAALMFAYNYIMMTAKPKIWADHLDDDIVEPEPETTYYDILLADDGVTADLVTVDKETAAEGDTVTITALDTLETLTVTDEDSEEVVVTQDSSLYTFEMPASDVIIAATAAEEPAEPNSIEGTDFDENEGNFGTVTVSLENETPIEATYVEDDLYSDYELMNALYNDATKFTDSSMYEWTKDGEPISDVVTSGDLGNVEPLVYTYDNNGEDAPMFTVEYDGNVFTLTPGATGEFVATLISEPAERPYSLSTNDTGDTSQEWITLSLSYTPTAGIEGTYEETLTDDEAGVAEEIMTQLNDMYDPVSGNDPYLDGATIQATCTPDEHGNLTWPVYFKPISGEGDTVAAINYDSTENTYTIEIYTESTGMDRDGFSWEYDYVNPDYVDPDEPQETEINYTFWEDVTVADIAFKRYLNEDTIQQEHIYTEQEFPDYAPLYVVHVDETDYTFEDKNYDADGYCWADNWDGVTADVAIKYNQDTVHPDIYVEANSIGQGAISATYSG